MHDASVGFLQDLIRIPSVNPPRSEHPDAELQVANRIAAELGEVGLDPELIEPVPGRGSVHVRLRADKPAGKPLLLLSHLDVVPVSESGWTYPPFGAVIADGYLYGRGAVDMKAAVAMQVGVVKALAEHARVSGRDPAREGIPGLRRDVLLTCTADEEEGGTVGARWIADNRPDWLMSEGALSECGAISMNVAGRRLYPIQVAEKGSAGYRISIRGAAGHSSMPREDNAVVLAGEVIRRLSQGGPIRITPLMRRVITEVAAALGRRGRAFVDLIELEDISTAEAAIRRVCDPTLGRAFLALLRDTFSPNVVRSGIKYSMIPGEAVLEVGCRMLPGSSESDLRGEIERRLGVDLLPRCEITLIRSGPPVEAAASGPLFDTLVECLREHDPDGIVVPTMAPYSTDARHTALLAIPTYGFTPLKLEAKDRFLDQFHGDDECVPISGMRWGLPVLYDAVRRFCT